MPGRDSNPRPSAPLGRESNTLPQHHDACSMLTRKLCNSRLWNITWWTWRAVRSAVSVWRRWRYRCGQWTIKHGGVLERSFIAAATTTSTVRTDCWQHSQTEEFTLGSQSPDPPNSPNFTRSLSYDSIDTTAFIYLPNQLVHSYIKRVWVAGKKMWSDCYIRSTSECFRDNGLINKGLIKLHIPAYAIVL